MTERDIFIAALQKEGPAQRQAYLDEACAQRPELRKQVEDLLRLYEGAGSFLQKPAAESAATGEERFRPTIDDPTTERPGAVIKNYKLLEQIGEGGMGTVWMAQQTEPVKRLVALKLIKAGMDSKQVIARFEAERQALALMDHPSIARVLEAGTTSVGRPYFVMELVKGVPITKYCDEHRLTPRQRLELFVPVCQAVQHAHQKGIIHRDLKPSNVLVALYDGKPVPKVIDFGVAKAARQSLTDKTLVTGFGAIVGTLEYMSPEQAETNQLDIDTRSDIYSLGVLLYELLAGSPPFSRKDLEKAGMLEMLRVIREQEPSKPSTKLSSSDALPTLSANRGTEPAKLAKLVRGELDWIVMKALEKDRGRRYETANGFAMDVQRYLTDEAVLACPPSVGYRLRKFVRRNKGKLAAAAVLGLALLVAVSGIGWAVRDRVARQEEAQRERADRQAKTAEQIQLILDEVARLEREQKWSEALEAARRASDMLAGGDADAEVVGRVRSAIDDLELVRLLDDIRVSQSQWKQTSFDYGGTAERFAAAFRNAGIDLAQLTPEEAARRVQSRPAVLAALVPALDDWASCHRATEDEPLAQSVWKVAGLVDPDPWRQKVRQARVGRDVKALQALVEAPDLARQPAATLWRLGLVLQRMDQSDTAVRVLRLAQQQYPSDFWVHFDLAFSLEHQEPPRLEQAAGCYRAALAVRPENTATWNNLGLVLRKQKKLADASNCFQRAIELDPKHTFAHINLGGVWLDQGKLDDAVAWYNKGIQLDPNHAVAHYNLGVVRFEQGKVDEALQCYQRAVALDQNYAMAHNNLGVVYMRQGEFDDAVASCQRAIGLEPKNAIFHRNLGDALSMLKRFDDAARALQRAIELEPENAKAHTRLGVLLASQNKHSDAIACYRKAIELDPSHGSTHLMLGNALTNQRRFDDAIVAYRRAIELEPKNALPLARLGVALNQQGKLDDAIACLQQAIELDSKLVMAHERLGAILCDQKKDYDGAIAAFRRVLALEPERGIGHFNLGLALARRGDVQEAIASYRNSFRLNPTHAQARINLARLLTTAADPQLRNAPEALEAARKGAELSPQSVEAWLVLGWAQYRSGDWKASIEALKKSMVLHSSPNGGNARHWFFLAMAHWQTGAKEEANRWYNQAVAWMDRNAAADEELRRIRAEAEELLEVNKKR